MQLDERLKSLEEHEAVLNNLAHLLVNTDTIANATMRIGWRSDHDAALDEFMDGLSKDCLQDPVTGLDEIDISVEEKCASRLSVISSVRLYFMIPAGSRA